MCFLRQHSRLNICRYIKTAVQSMYLCLLLIRVIRSIFSQEEKRWRQSWIGRRARRSALASATFSTQGQAIFLKEAHITKLRFSRESPRRCQIFTFVLYFCSRSQNLWVHDTCVVGAENDHKIFISMGIFKFKELDWIVQDSYLSSLWNRIFESKEVHFRYWENVKNIPSN